MHRNGEGWYTRLVVVNADLVVRLAGTAPALFPTAKYLRLVFAASNPGCFEAVFDGPAVSAGIAEALVASVLPRWLGDQQVKLE